MTSSVLYDRDFYAWANEQAMLLRERKLDLADIDNIAREIESMGKGEKRELVSRLTILLLHLLKWQYQPVRRGSSWQTTIRVQRNDLERHMSDNPSLQSTLSEAIMDAYKNARIRAADETALLEKIFPEICPWSFDQMMDEKFWPQSLQDKSEEG